MRESSSSEKKETCRKGAIFPPHLVGRWKKELDFHRRLLRLRIPHPLQQHQSHRETPPRPPRCVLHAGLDGREAKNAEERWKRKRTKLCLPHATLCPTFCPPLPSPRFSLHPPFLKKTRRQNGGGGGILRNAVRFPLLFFLFFFAEGTETFNFFFYGRLTWSVDAVFSYTRGKRLSFACVCFYWGGME